LRPIPGSSGALGKVSNHGFRDKERQSSLKKGEKNEQ